MSRRLMWLYVGLVFLFLYLPIFVLVVFSFNNSHLNVSWSGFTLEWYGRLWQDSDIMLATRNSLVVASFSTVISTLLGTGLALGLYRSRGWVNRVTDALVYVPLVVPETVMGISLLALFTRTGIGLGLTSIILAHVAFSVPFVTLVVQARLSGLDHSMVEAAMDLGATEVEALRRVILPLARPGVIAGALLAFTLSLDDFIVTFFTAGPGSTTLPLYIYSMVKLGVTPKVNALSALLLVVTTTAVLLFARLESIGVANDEQEQAGGT